MNEQPGWQDQGSLNQLDEDPSLLNTSHAQAQKLPRNPSCQPAWNLGAKEGFQTGYDKQTRIREGILSTIPATNKHPSCAWGYSHLDQLLDQL